MWHESIIFSLVDGEGVAFSYKDILVIITIFSSHKAYKVLVDDKGVVKILSYKVLTYKN